MGVAFRPAGCITSAEECGNESPDIDIGGSPRGATKIKETPAGGLTGITCLPRRRGCNRSSGKSGPEARPRAAEDRSNASSPHRICRSGAAEQFHQMSIRSWSASSMGVEGGDDSIMRPCRSCVVSNTAHPVVLRERPTREARRSRED
jgi:hypothetical protein